MIPAWSLPIIVIVLGGIVAGVFTIWSRRGGEKVARKTPLPPTWPEMWARIDALEAKIETRDKELAARDQAFANILTDAADQWPSDRPGPLFDREDVDILGDTVPSKWLNRVRPVI